MLTTQEFLDRQTPPQMAWNKIKMHKIKVNIDISIDPLSFKHGLFVFLNHVIKYRSKTSEVLFTSKKLLVKLFKNKKGLIIRKILFSIVMIKTKD